MPLSYVGDENFLGKKNKAKRQEKKTARKAKRANKQAARIEKRVDRKAAKLDRKLGKAATMRATGKPGKTLAGKILKGAATVALPGLMVPLAIANKQAEKREAAAAEAQAEQGTTTNSISEVANLSTPLTPTTTGGGEFSDGPEGGFDQPTSGWDADAERVSDAVNQAEEEGGYEAGSLVDDAGNVASEEEEYEYEESFFGKATTPEQKKKNQKTLAISLVSLVILCLLVWFITRYIKK